MLCRQFYPPLSYCRSGHTRQGLCLYNFIHSAAFFFMHFSGFSFHFSSPLSWTDIRAFPLAFMIHTACDESCQSVMQQSLQSWWQKSSFKERIMDLGAVTFRIKGIMIFHLKKNGISVHSGGDWCDGLKDCPVEVSLSRTLKELLLTVKAGLGQSFSLMLRICFHRSVQTSLNKGSIIKDKNIQLDKDRKHTFTYAAYISQPWYFS